MNPLAHAPVRPLGQRAARAATTASAALFALSVALLLGSLLSDPVLRWTSPSPFVAFEVDRLAALLLVLVTGVAAVVQAHARRSLRGEACQRELALLGVALTLALIGLVTAATLVSLALAWVLTGVLTTQLVGLRTSGGTGAPARAATFLVGDLALVIAVATTTAVAGTVSIGGSGDLSRAAGELGPWLGPVALLIVVAVAARCAQVPLGSWLPGSVDAPTPVSALLHAGVVNGGGLLLLRTAPVLDAWPVAWAVLVALATASAFVATLVMSVSTDVKGALVRSTSAQMGFMLVTIAAGLPAAAIAHLGAHGMFKAALFLGAGDVVHQDAVRRSLPGPDAAGGGVRRLVASAAVVVVAVTTTVAIMEATGLGVAVDASKVVLLGFATATATVVLHGWLRHAATTSAAVRAAATVAGCCAAYVAGMAVLTAFLGPGLGTPAGIGALAFVPIIGATGAIWLAQHPALVPASVRAPLQVAAINATHPAAPGRRTVARPPADVRRRLLPPPARRPASTEPTAPAPAPPVPVPTAEVAA